jgi:hypothetical protein
MESRPLCAYFLHEHKGKEKRAAVVDCCYIFQYITSEHFNVSVLSVLYALAFWDFSHSYKEEQNVDGRVGLHTFVVMTP